MIVTVKNNIHPTLYSFKNDFSKKRPFGKAWSIGVDTLTKIRTTTEKSMLLPLFPTKSHGKGSLNRNKILL